MSPIYRLAIIVGLTTIFTTGCIANEASMSPSQLDMARRLRGEAQLIVAIAPRSIVADDPAAPRFQIQNFKVSGQVVRCFKSSAAPPTTIAYLITAEGEPAALGQPHIAFLRRSGRRWTAIDGPIFRDTITMRVGLARLTRGCPR